MYAAEVCIKNSDNDEKLVSAKQRNKKSDNDVSCESMFEILKI